MRQVKCYKTGETIDMNNAYKGDGHWFKDEDTFTTWRMEEGMKKDAYQNICAKAGMNNRAPNAYLKKILNELIYIYGIEPVWRATKEQYQVKGDSSMARLHYAKAVIHNKANDIKERLDAIRRKEQADANLPIIEEEVEVVIVNKPVARRFGL